MYFEFMGKLAVLIFGLIITIRILWWWMHRPHNTFTHICKYKHNTTYCFGGGKFYDESSDSNDSEVKAAQDALREFIRAEIKTSEKKEK